MCFLDKILSMNKIVFLCSHEYSGSNFLYESMDKNPRIQGYKNLSFIYTSPNELISLTQQKHKLENRAAIYMDEILYNWQLFDKNTLKVCKFIHVVRRPESVLNYFSEYKKLSPEFALRYYLFRLRRICEIAKRTPEAVLLTYDDLIEGKGMNLIEDYLELKNPIDFHFNDLPEVKSNFPMKSINEAETAYERYLYFLKNQNLVFTSK